MKGRKQHHRQGSILIVVLWILLLISMLAGRYLSHNRGKAAAAAYGWQSLVREQAFQSVLELYATGGQPLPEQENAGEIQPPADKENSEPAGATGLLPWHELTIGGLVRESPEKKRINLNSAADDVIRKQIRQGLGEDRLEEADQVTDALLDWRDPDDLVRSDGAEVDFYRQEGVSYKPADGPFKSLTEMLLVRGVSPELFWGDASVVASSDPDNQANDADGGREATFSLINAFTISGKNVKRVEVLFPQDGGSARAFIALLQPKGPKWSLLRCYRCYLPAAGKEKETGEEG